MTDEELMKIALSESLKALEHDDVPVGAIVIVGGEILSARHNEREFLNDPSAHAEVLALRDAAAVLGVSRLDDATLVSTLEPCPMCAGAALNARVDRVIFGAEDPKSGALGSLYQLGSDPRLNHEFSVTGKILQEECGKVLSDFFNEKRK